MNFRNISNVRRDDSETPPVYLCELELELDGVWEKAEHVARRGGGGICDAVHDAIERGEYEGEIVAYEPPTPPAIRTITVAALRARFTRDERVQLTKAASTDAELRVFLDDLSAQGRVDLDHPDVIAGVDAMVDRGLITPERRAELLRDGTPEET